MQPRLSADQIQHRERKAALAGIFAGFLLLVLLVICFGWILAR